MAVHVLLLAVGFVLLYYGAEWLVKGSSNLARSFGIPPIVIGLTVVAFGTSAPEFVVTVISSLEGKSMIAVGNVIGSNICNIALVLGLAAVLQPITCHRVVVKRDIPIMLMISIAVLVVCMDDRLGRVEGILLFSGLILYTVMNYVFAKRGTAETVEIPDEVEDTGDRLIRFKEVFTVLVCAAAISLVSYLTGEVKTAYFGIGLLVVAALAFGGQEGLRLRAGSRLLMVLLVVAGIYGVVQGASVVVGAAEHIMRALGVDEKFVGLTIVAFGTSLPELATSVVAALRKEMDISIGNLVGSNVFNLLGVLGVASMLEPIQIPGGFVGSGMVVDGFVMLGTSALPLLFMLRQPTVKRWHGAILLLCYIGYLAYLILTPSAPTLAS